MRKIRTHIKGLYILKGKKFSDSRGWLREVFKLNYFNKNNIFTIVSKSKKNVCVDYIYKRKIPKIN